MRCKDKGEGRRCLTHCYQGLSPARLQTKKFQARYQKNPGGLWVEYPDMAVAG